MPPAIRQSTVLAACERAREMERACPESPDGRHEFKTEWFDDGFNGAYLSYLSYLVYCIHCGLDGDGDE